MVAVALHHEQAHIAACGTFGFADVS